MTTMRGTGFQEAVAIDKVPTSLAPQIEVGRTGLKRNGGYIDDEFLPQLRGRKAVQIFREMADNSAIAAAWINTVQQLLRQIEWRVEPASNNPEDVQNAEFLEGCMKDMEHSWGDMIAEIGSMLIYGWSNHFIVYKKREGLWAKDQRNASKFKDGKFGWRKIPIRSQETLLRWAFHPTSGECLAMVQMAPPNYDTVVIPLSRCLLFRYKPNKESPEGYSPLRPMYRSWFMLKRLEEHEAVGVERDLTGMPVGRVPAEYLSAAKGTPEWMMVDAMRKAVTAVRRNEQEGLVFPQKFDPETKQPDFDFELLNSGGSRQFDTDAIIQRYETRMLMCVLADFIMTGHEDSGASYALHTDKSGIFRTGINSIAQSIADVFNRKAVPQLFALNGMKPDALPEIVPNDVDPPDLGQLAQFMTALAQAGVQWFPDPQLEKFLRDAARLPQLDDDTEKVQEQMQRQQNIINLANQQMQALQIHQQAAQGEMQTQQQALGLQQQAQAGPEQAPQNPNQQAQAQVTAQKGKFEAQAAKVKVDQEKQKLANLKKPAPKPAAKKAPVKKSLTVNGFGIDHGRAA